MFRHIKVLCSVLLLGSVMVLAQGTTSRISGVVTDSSGAVVSGAIVTVTNDDTGATFTIKTSGAGTYTFDSLQIGRYSVKVEAPGFSTYISKGNVLSIGQPTSVDPKLVTGGSNEVVTVEGGYDLVQTESSGNFGGIIDNKTLTELPIVGTRGRNPVGLVQFMPGVVSNGANATGGGINVNGSRDRAWNYVLDGIDANESSSGGSNTSPPHQNPDMLSEFRVITSNPTAEFGRNSGAQVLMVTKSGTNQFHGNAFWFYQTPALRANTPQNKSAISTTAPNGLPRSQFVQNIPGGSIGGPIWRDKAFFFANVELLHALSSSTVTRTVYTSSLRAGNYRYVPGLRNTPYGASGASVDANGNPVGTPSTFNIPANDPYHVGLDPTTQAVLAQTPLPNTFTVGDGLNTAGYTFVAPSTDKQVDVTFKVDYRFNAHNTIFARYMGGHQNTDADITNSGQQLYPGGPAQVNTKRFPRNFAANYRFSPTDRITNELVVGLNRFGYRFENPALGTTLQSTPYTFAQTASPINAFAGNNRFLTTYQLVDNVTYVRGAHVFKAGINFRYQREIDQRGSIGSVNAIPQVSFSGNAPGGGSLASYGYNTTAGAPSINSNDLTILNNAINDTLGRIGSTTAGYLANKDLSAFRPAGTVNNMDHRWPEYDYYIQDTWHASPKLVIDFGLRLDVRSAPDFKTLAGLQATPFPRYGTVLGSNISFTPGKYMDTRYNWGPSVGFAYDLSGNGKTAIRGNFRMAYDRINSFSFSSSVFQGMPGLTYQVTNTTVGQDSGAAGHGVRAQNWAPPTPPAGVTPLALTTPPAYSANSITVSDPNTRTPTVGMWGLSIQHELAKNTVLTVAYIGNHGTHLYDGYDSNQVEYRSNGILSNFLALQAAGTGAGAGVAPLLDQITNADTRKGSTSTYNFINNTLCSGCLSGTGGNVALATNAVASLANTLANRLQNATTANPNGVPLVVTAGLSPTLLKPYQQYLGGVFVLQSGGYSNYNGLQFQLDKRFSQGYSITVNYTYSKSMDTRSFDPAFTTVATGSSQSAAGTPFDYHNPRLNYGPSDFDNTSVINGYFVANVPYGRGRHFGRNANIVLDEILGGWQLSGDGNWQSGRPLTLFAGYNTFSGSLQSTPICTGSCSHTMAHVHQEANGYRYFLSIAQKAQFSTPAAGQNGNMGRNWLRQNATWNADANLSKSFKTFHEQYLQLRLEGQNIFNTVSYDTTGSQLISSSVFSRLNTATDGVTNTSPRRFQLAAKYVF